MAHALEGKVGGLACFLDVGIFGTEGEELGVLQVHSKTIELNAHPSGLFFQIRERENGTTCAFFHWILLTE
jgi:hypothetical protein